MTTTSLPSDAGDATVESAAPTLRPLRSAFWFGGFNGLTWMISLGTPMVLLAEHLGASAFQVGLASSFVFLLLPIQVVATSALPHFGFKRQMVGAWLVRAAFLAAPLWLAWAEYQHPEPWMPALLVASVFGFCLCRAVGTAAHLPWMAIIVPLELRGRFFATDHAITSVVGVATLVGGAACFAALPPYAAFRIVYVVALVGALLAVWNLSRLPAADAPPAPPLRAMAATALELWLRPGLFRQYLGVMVCGALVTSSFAPFTVYYLKSVGSLPSSQIMLFTAAQFGGHIVGAAGIRHRIDRMPLPRFFQGAVALIAAVDLFWIALLAGADSLVPWLGVAYFVFGAGIGMSNVAHFTYLPELSGEEQRPVTMALFAASHGLVSGLAPMLWGLALKGTGPAPTMNVDHFFAYFVVAVAMGVLLLALYARLPDLRPSLEEGRGRPRSSRRS